MGILNNFLSRRKETENRFSDASLNDRIMSEVDNRKRSHSERELIQVLEKEHQVALKDALYWEEKRRQAYELLKARQSMKFNPEFFNGPSILKDNHNFLRGNLW